MGNRRFHQCGHGVGVNSRLDDHPLIVEARELLVVGPQDEALPTGNAHQQRKPADYQQVTEESNCGERLSSAEFTISLRVLCIQFIFTVIPLVARGAQIWGCWRLAVAPSSIPYEYFTQPDVKSVRTKPMVSTRRTVL